MSRTLEQLELMLAEHLEAEALLVRELLDLGEPTDHEPPQLTAVRSALLQRFEENREFVMDVAVAMRARLR